jgi:redox-sensing transcriptional repressor
VLIDFIDTILYSEETMKVAVLGMGHLGQAITKYFNSKNLNIRIVAALDIDEAKVGQTILDIPCYHIDDLEDVVANNDISIVILSLPSSVAAQYTVPIVNSGIKGVLNFTSAPFNFTQGIVVENYDITTVLEKVAYFVKANEENNNQ